MWRKKYWPFIFLFILAIFYAIKDGHNIESNQFRSRKMNAFKKNGQISGKTKNNTLQKRKEKKHFSKAKIPRRYGRILVGNEAGQFENTDAKLVMINFPHLHWKRLTRKNLLRHRIPDAQIHIKVLGSYIKIKNGKGQFVEKILVTNFKKGKERSSFNAIVDSQTGNILSTYNRTIHEHFSSSPKFQWTVHPLQNH